MTIPLPQSCHPSFKVGIKQVPQRCQKAVKSNTKYFDDELQIVFQIHTHTHTDNKTNQNFYTLLTAYESSNREYSNITTP